MSKQEKKYRDRPTYTETDAHGYRRMARPTYSKLTTMGPDRQKPRQMALKAPDRSLPRPKNTDIDGYHIKYRRVPIPTGIYQVQLPPSPTGTETEEYRYGRVSYHIRTDTNWYIPSAIATESDGYRKRRIPIKSLFCFYFPEVFFHSRAAGACSATTNLNPATMS